MVWRQFAHQIKEEKLHTLYTAMMSRDPKIKEGYHILFSVDNGVQLDFIKHQRTRLVNFLRKELNNGAIQLKTIEAESEGKKKIFTSSDKFDDMAKRNPSLNDLRQRFKLDIDL